MSAIAVHRPLPAEVLRRLDAAYRAAADESLAGPMAAYMRDQFAFLGIKSPARRRLDRGVRAGLDRPTERDVHEIVLGCWRLPEREFQYFGCEYFARYVSVCSPRALRFAKQAITSKSWWDTVDALASNVVGELVRAHPALVTDMDGWIDHRDFWLARVALLHQNRYKADTDADRLFDYCLRRAGDDEFFVRKAIGWALRTYSKTDPEAVEQFVRRHDAELSPLSQKEAMKVIERSRRA